MSLQAGGYRPPFFNAARALRRSRRLSARPRLFVLLDVTVGEDLRLDPDHARRELGLLNLHAAIADRDGLGLSCPTLPTRSSDGAGRWPSELGDLHALDFHAWSAGLAKRFSRRIGVFRAGLSLTSGLAIRQRRVDARNLAHTARWRA